MQFRMAQKRRAYSPGASQSQPSSGRRKKRNAVVRLGGQGRRKGKFFGALRLRLRMRWPWLASVYRRALRWLRTSYEQALRELIDGSVLMGALHAPIGVDCAHAASFGPMATVGF